MDHIEWADLDVLTRNIADGQHEDLRQLAGVISESLADVSQRCGRHRVQFARLIAAFEKFSSLLCMHILTEQTLLFPYIDGPATASRSGVSLPPWPFGTILNPIRVGTNLRRALRGGAPLETLRETVRAAWTSRTDRGAETRLAARGPDARVPVPVSPLDRDVHLEMHARGG